MFIKNLKSGIITEIQNQDVIKHCKKHSDEYEVAESLSGFGKEPKPEETPIEEPEEEIEEPEEAETADEAEEETEEPEEASEVDYASLSVADLRKVAKEKGIQGYANMNKETLVEVIKAHE